MEAIQLCALHANLSMVKDARPVTSLDVFPAVRSLLIWSSPQMEASASTKHAIYKAVFDARTMLLALFAELATAFTITTTISAIRPLITAKFLIANTATFTMSRTITIITAIDAISVAQDMFGQTKTGPASWFAQTKTAFSANSPQYV